VGYFFCVISAFTVIMAFMMLLTGVNNSTFDKFRHYPRPIVERTVTPAPPNKELYLYIPNPKSKVALQTNEATAPKDLSAPEKNTKNSRAAPIAKADAENRKPERKIKPERLAHLRQPKVPARQRQNYEGPGYAMTSGSGGYSRALELDGIR
jgi:hypothetical protein